MVWLTKRLTGPLLIVSGILLSGCCGFLLQICFTKITRGSLTDSIENYLVLCFIASFVLGPSLFGAGTIAICLRLRDRQRHGKDNRAVPYPWETDWEAQFGFRSHPPAKPEPITKES